MPGPPYQTPYHYFAWDAKREIQANRSWWTKANIANTISALWAGDAALKAHYANSGNTNPGPQLPVPNPIPMVPYTAADAQNAKKGNGLPPRTPVNIGGGDGDDGDDGDDGHNQNQAATAGPEDDVRPEAIRPPVSPLSPGGVDKFPYVFWPKQPWTSLPPDLPIVFFDTVREPGTLDAWLATKPLRADSEDKWHGIRFMGAGGCGAAGLWMEADEFDNIKDTMVIKDVQQEPKQWRDPMYWRNSLPRELENHRLIEERRQAEPDMCRYLIHSRGHRLCMAQRRYRLYLDYYNSGQLWSPVSEQLTQEAIELIPESFIWYMMRALASACLVLQRGTTANEPLPHWKAITHLDIVLTNIFAQTTKRKRGNESDRTGEIEAGTSQPSKRRKVLSPVLRSDKGRRSSVSSPAQRSDKGRRSPVSFPENYEVSTVFLDDYESDRTVEIESDRTVEIEDDESDRTVEIEVGRSQPSLRQNAPSLVQSNDKGQRNSLSSLEDYEDDDDKAGQIEAGRSQPSLRQNEPSLVQSNDKGQRNSLSSLEDYEDDEGDRAVEIEVEASGPSDKSNDEGNENTGWSRKDWDNVSVQPVLADFDQAFYSLDETGNFPISDNPEDYLFYADHTRYPPERQYQYGPPWVRFNEKTDVWGIGSALYMFVINKALDQGPVREDTLDGIPLSSHEHFDQNRETHNLFTVLSGTVHGAANFYSSKLKKLVASCLEWNPHVRPSLQVLVDLAEEELSRPHMKESLMKWQGFPLPPHAKYFELGASVAKARWAMTSQSSGDS